MKELYRKILKITNKYKYDVSKKGKMIPPAEKKLPIKMTGYLEKRSKMGLVSRWKKLWFVLEGRLLLYYKSQLEYLSLSPCRGTVNLGLAASVLPGASQEIVVSTRSHTVSLRALNKPDHDMWLQALIDAMCAPNPSHSLCCKKPLHHFRYSMQSQSRELLNYQAPYAKGQLKSSSNLELSRDTTNNAKRNGSNVELSDCHRMMLKKTSKAAMSDTSIPGKFKPSANDDNEVMKRSLSFEEDLNRHVENIYESLKDIEPFESVRSNFKQGRNKLNRSDSDCFTMMSRQRILNNNRLDFSPFRNDSMQFRRMNKGIRQPPLPPLPLAHGRGLRELRSDSDLSSASSSARPPSFRTPTHRHSSYDFGVLTEIDELVTTDDKQKRSTFSYYPTPRVHSHDNNSSLYRRSYGSNEFRIRPKMSIKKRSLSFLKRFWKGREDKDPVESTTYCYPPEMQGPDSDLEHAIDQTTLRYIPSEPEPPPDYDQPYLQSLKPRHAEQEPQRCESPWHDVPRNNQPVYECFYNSDRLTECNEEDDDDDWKCAEDSNNNTTIPNTPTGKNDSVEFHRNSPNEDDELEDEKSSSSEDITAMLDRLAAMNAKPLQPKNNDDAEDPDYDIPRPHGSLIPLLNYRRGSSQSIGDVMQPTNFLSSHFEDSLDLIPFSSLKHDFSMAPDSLECDPWSSIGTDLEDGGQMTGGVGTKVYRQDSLNVRNRPPPLLSRLQ